MVSSRRTWRCQPQYWLSLFYQIHSTHRPLVCSGESSSGIVIRGLEPCAMSFSIFHFRFLEFFHECHFGAFDALALGTGALPGHTPGPVGRQRRDRGGGAIGVGGSGGCGAARRLRRARGGAAAAAAAPAGAPRPANHGGGPGVPAR
eukprot:1193640-Prorocentrum_minimum.AAC.1